MKLSNINLFLPVIALLLLAKWYILTAIDIIACTILIFGFHLSPGPVIIIDVSASLIIWAVYKLITMPAVEDDE